MSFHLDDQRPTEKGADDDRDRQSLDTAGAQVDRVVNGVHGCPIVTVPTGPIGGYAVSASAATAI
jgi:hypothetical protein